MDVLHALYALMFVRWPVAVYITMFLCSLVLALLSRVRVAVVIVLVRNCIVFAPYIFGWIPWR